MLSQRQQLEMLENWYMASSDNLLSYKWMMCCNYFERSQNFVTEECIGVI